MYRFTTPTPPQLTIAFRAGDISIHTDDVEETTVALSGASDPETQAQIADTVVRQRGDSVVVLVPKRSGGLFGGAPALRLDITAPHDSRLGVKSGSADLTAQGTYADTRVASGSGDVSVERLTGAAHLRSGSGDVHVQATTRDLTIGTGSGDVSVGVAEAALTLQTGSGDIAVESVAGDLKANTGSGDIEVGSAGGDVRAQSGSGSVSVHRVAYGRIKAQAASGDLRVGVADGTPAWLDVRTVTGGVDNDLEAAEPVGAGEQYVRLELKTVSGDIEIARV